MPQSSGRPQTCWARLYGYVSRVIEPKAWSPVSHDQTPIRQPVRLLSQRPSVWKILLMFWIGRNALMPLLHYAMQNGSRFSNTFILLCSLMNLVNLWILFSSYFKLGIMNDQSFYIDLLGLFYAPEQNNEVEILPPYGSHWYFVSCFAECWNMV